MVSKEKLTRIIISQIQKHAENEYLNHLVDPNFQGVNRLFTLSFENENGRISHLEYFLSQVEIKDRNKCRNIMLRLMLKIFLINQ